jgi:hypothetical protein
MRLSVERLICLPQRKLQKENPHPKTPLFHDKRKSFPISWTYKIYLSFLISADIRYLHSTYFLPLSGQRSAMVGGTLSWVFYKKQKTVICCKEFCQAHARFDSIDHKLWPFVCLHLIRGIGMHDKQLPSIIQVGWWDFPLTLHLDL